MDREDREASSGDKSVASVEKMRLDPFISCLSCAIKLSACRLYPKEEWPFVLNELTGPATADSLQSPGESMLLSDSTTSHRSVEIEKADGFNSLWSCASL
jgi:hypothetical protein